MLDENDHGNKIQLSQGEEMVISLDANPSTGYGWQVAEIDETILRQVGETVYITSDSAGQPSLGKPDKEVLRFLALSPGVTPLSLIYTRPWEDKVEPEEVFSIEVNVR